MKKFTVENLRSFKRVNVIGSSGSGKSEFSRRLAEILCIPFIEMDSLSWEADWKEAGTADLINKIEKKFAHGAWVLDGNYNKIREFKWKNVQLVIWLDYPFRINLYRLLKRTIRRAVTKEELWIGTGNRESFRMSFFSRKSVLLWLFNSYSRTKRNYFRMITDKQYPEITFIHLKSPKEADELLKEFRSACQIISASS